MPSYSQSPYRNVLKSFALYWDTYGGWRAFFFSPYLHITILISILAYPVWRCPGRKTPWFDFTLSVLPDLLGFTLGGYAILLAFGDERFRKLLAGKKDEKTTSPFMVVNGAFIHFIIIQVFSILFAVIGNIWGIETGLFAWVGFTSFLYSLMTAVAAALAVLNVAKWFDMWRSYEDEDNEIHKP